MKSSDPLYLRNIRRRIHWKTDNEVDEIEQIIDENPLVSRINPLEETVISDMKLKFNGISIVSKTPLRNPITQHSGDIYKCPNCLVTMDMMVVENLYICGSCGLKRDVRQPLAELSARCSYVNEALFSNPIKKRLSFFVIKLTQIQGLGSPRITNETLDTVCHFLSSSVYGHFTNYTLEDVDRALRDARFQTLYKWKVVIFCRITGVQPPRLDEIVITRLKSRFIKFQAPFQCFEYKKLFLSYPFTILLLCTIEGVQDIDKFVIMMKGKKKALVQLSIFEKVFEELGWLSINNVDLKIKEIRDSYLRK